MTEQRTALERARRTLNERIATLEAAIADKADYGPGEGDPRVTRWELNLALLEQLRERAGSVEHALSKIQDGQYGMCELCGQAIQPDRLEALPDTRLCIDCARSEPAAVPGARRGPCP